MDIFYHSKNLKLYQKFWERGVFILEYPIGQKLKDILESFELNGNKTPIPQLELIPNLNKKN